jgi:PTS system fructose-specific IIC component
VAVGSHLDWRRLRNAKKRLGMLLLLEITITPVLVFLVVIATDVDRYTAMLLATMAISTAPATILAIVKETRSKGMFVKTLLVGVALNNLACICLFEIAHSIAAASLESGTHVSTLEVLFAPLRQLALSAALGVGIGALLIFTTRHIVRPDRLAAASLIAILLTTGLGSAMEISTLLSCLFLGITLANGTPDKDEIGSAVFDNFEYAIFALFFTLAGLELDFRYVGPAGVIAVFIFLARLTGKVSAGHLAMRWAGATDRVRRYLGVALIPQAGLAIGLMLLVTEDDTFADMRDFFLAVTLTVVLLNEIVGPIMTRFAMVRSGDYRKDRARLIDFLHEENIVTDLTGTSKEEAYERMIDVLLKTNQLKITREEFSAGVFEREDHASTCLGHGLAIPHARLDSGGEIVGAMGISREGIDMDTPDGVPIHCIVMLATPTGARDRHLEVLSALALAIGSDHTIQQQLYHSTSPAHAYEVLHAEDQSEDFNYFLES